MLESVFTACLFSSQQRTFAHKIEHSERLIRIISKKLRTQNTLNLISNEHVLDFLHNTKHTRSALHQKKEM